MSGSDSFVGYIAFKLRLLNPSPRKINKPAPSTYGSGAMVNAVMATPIDSTPPDDHTPQAYNRAMAGDMNP